MYKNIFKSDDAFMGTTHALSAVAVFLLLTWVARDFIFGRVLGTTNAIVYIAGLIIVVGAALMPDLDANQSTSISTLGFIGRGLSISMREFSRLVQGLIKGPYDKDMDPHRGFWHTAVSAVTIGLLVRGLTGIQTIITLPLVKRDVSIAVVAVVFILFISMQLMLASLFTKKYKKAKNASTLGRIAVPGVSLIIAIVMLMSLPSDISYSWVGYSVSLGWLIHILGDSFTVAGVPVFFPLKHKGKRWWMYRMPICIKAGGAAEYGVVTPILVIVTIMSLIKVLPMLAG